MAIAQDWKDRIVDAEAADAVKVLHHERVMPPFNLPAWPSAPRALRTPLIEQLQSAPERVDPDEVVTALRAGDLHRHLPFAGQSAALVHEILPAAEIVRRVVSEAEAALRAAAAPSA